MLPAFIVLMRPYDVLVNSSFVVVVVVVVIDDNNQATNAILIDNPSFVVIVAVTDDSNQAIDVILIDNPVFYCYLLLSCVSVFRVEGDAERVGTHPEAASHGVHLAGDGRRRGGLKKIPGR